MRRIWFLCFLLIFLLQLAAGAEEVRMEYFENGLPLIFKKTEANNILGVVCMVKTGSAYERVQENGAAGLVQTLLMKGTKNKSAAELALALEGRGISMNTDASEDYVSLSAVATVDQMTEVLELMEEILFEPAFPSEQVEKEKRNASAYIRLKEDNKFYLTFRNLRQLLFEGHPYALSPDGTPETLSMISRQAILSFHERFYQPQNMILSVVGNVSYDDLKQNVQKTFGSRESLPVQIASWNKTISPAHKSRVIEKNIEQGFVNVGYIGVPMSHRDFPALRVASAVLGEGMSSRLFVHLRDKQGLAYVVGSMYMNLDRQGALVGFIGTRPDTIENAARGMRTIISDFDNKPIPEEELERAKNYVIGKFLINHQTNLKKAFYLAWFEMLGLGLEYDKKYPDVIRSVDGADVRRAATKYLQSPCVVKLTPVDQSDNKKNNNNQ